MQESNKIETIKQWLGTGSINIFGLPFAGKDTHGQLLAAKLDGNVLGGGDILRNSAIPEHVRAIMDRGDLIPTDDFIRIVLPYLSSQSFSRAPLILSSVGRWRGEEPGVIGAAQDSGHPLKAVLFLDIAIKTAYQRFSLSNQQAGRQRADDDKDKLIVRFSEFEEKTMPVIDFYRQKDLVISIDGNPPVDEVQTSIIDELYQRAID